MIVSKPPKNIEEITSDNFLYNKEKWKSVFLAGSIEMGKAKKWQEEVEGELKNKKVHIFNPRRDDWDSSWEQNILNQQFRDQVDWEIKALDYVDIIFMYLDKNTMSPISLLELGMYLKSNKLMVCCPNGFKRKGNVDIVCAKFDIPTYNSLDNAIAALKLKL